MRNAYSEVWNKTQAIDCILFTDRWTVRVNELDSENISALLCQSKTEQLNTTIINDSVCIQQHKKQDHEDHIIFCKL